IVKGLFEDSHFRYSHKLAAINTVNWARIMIEIVYYFYAFFRIQEYHSSDLEIQHFRSVRFSIPSGSFGNALACYYAKLLGLPIHSIIVATNENDIMHRFLSKGIYEKNVLIETMSPAMDIQTASNFERFLFEITNRDSAFVNQSVHRMDVDRKIVLPPPIFNGIKEVFKSAAINQKQV
ncbi:tryptophan synthase beta subunit-like PLP-dependent enzyme, partial [Rozella allomycis CSF55]